MADTPPPPPGFTVDQPKPAPPPPPPTGFKLDAPAPKSVAPPAQTKVPAPPAGFTLDGFAKGIGESFMDIPREYQKEAGEGAAALKGDFTAPVQSHDKQGKPGAPAAKDYAARAGQIALDAMSYLSSPIHALNKSIVGRPVNKATGVNPELTANILDLVEPFGGKIKGAMDARRAAAGMRDMNEAAAAARARPETPSSLPKEGALAEPPAMTKPRTFEDQLFQLENNKVADRVEAVKHLDKVPPDIKPETWEKLYHYEESPGKVALSPEEQALYDQHVAPLKAEADALAKKLEGYGYPAADLDAEASSSKAGYTPRYVAGRTRSLGEALDQWKKGVETNMGGASGRSMRTTVDAQKSRRFYNAVNPDNGEKTVVHVGKDGTVQAFDGSSDPKQFGTFPRGQKIQDGSKVRVDGQTWRLEGATTKEIESVAATRYSKNLLANRLDNLAKLRSAVRNADFIESMKRSPDWHNVAVKVADTAEPPRTNGRAWRAPTMPQFRNYYMEPTVADALDDAHGRQHDLDGMMNAADKAGNIVKGSIFWNPFPHMRNVANHYLVEKGLVGTAKGLATGSMPSYLMKAARSVITQDPEYMRALRAGQSLPYARTISADLHKALITKLGEAVKQNPQGWAKIAQMAGHANPAEWVSALYRTSNKALWSFGDILSMARQMELREKGLPIGKAISKMEGHMPNYRIPGQVAGSRMVSQVLGTPLLSMFGRYQYNRMAAYMNMAKDLVGASVPLKDRAEALDKVAMLGVLLTMYYPALDKAWQAITGNKNAKVTRPGATSVPQAIMDVAKGDRGPAQAAASIFSPGPIEAPIEAFHGRYLWNGQPIAYPHNLVDGHPDQFARDIASWVGSKVSPVGQGQRILEGDTSVPQFLLSQIGVSTPTDQQAQSRKYFEAKDDKYATKRANKLKAKRDTKGLL